MWKLGGQLPLASYHHTYIWVQSCGADGTGDFGHSGTRPQEQSIWTLSWACLINNSSSPSWSYKEWKSCGPPRPGPQQTDTHSGGVTLLIWCTRQDVKALSCSTSIQMKPRVLWEDWRVWNSGIPNSVSFNRQRYKICEQTWLLK